MSFRLFIFLQTRKTLITLSRHPAALLYTILFPYVDVCGYDYHSFSRLRRIPKFSTQGKTIPDSAAIGSSGPALPCPNPPECDVNGNDNPKLLFSQQCSAIFTLNVIAVCHGWTLAPNY